LHLVYLPSHLNVRVLPQELKKEITIKIETFATSFQRDMEFAMNPYGRQRWFGLVDYMNSEDWSHKLPAMKEYLKINDKTREQNLTDVFPELEALWK